MRFHVSIMIGAIALTALAGCKDEEEAAEPLRAVRSLIVTPGAERESLTQSGEIVARREVAIGFKLGGRLASRPIEVGMAIQPGDVLATLDPQDLETQIRIAEAEVNAARAAVEAAQANADRQQLLLQKDIVSKAAVEAVEADRKTAEARLSAAEAQLTAARDQRGYADLRATEAGIVTAILVQAGEMAGAGQPILRVAKSGEREAAFNVAERYVAGALPGLPVTVSLLSDPSITTQGTLREVSPTADPVTRTYRVLVNLPKGAPDMAFGATVQGAVTFDLPGMISLPAASLTSQDGKPAVFVVSAEGILTRRSVTVARYEEDRVLLAEGLVAGDRVVTAGVSKLRPEQAVLVSEDGQ
jgi:RND family efflux transporter MFP subunit